MMIHGLRTWTSGSGDPPVVLLHGGPGLWDYLEPVADILAPVATVHRFDQRGCGGSSPRSVQSIAACSDDLEALRRHWGHDRWVVVGHSFGATLALAYAVAHPDRTLALGYVGGVGVGDWRAPARAEQARRMTVDQQRRLEKLADRRTPDEEAEFRALSWFTDYADPEDGWRAALADAGVDRPINWAANRALAADARRWTDAEVLAQASRLTMPCWFIHGDRDPRPIRTVADLAAAVPGSRMHVIQGAGHKPWHERPREFEQLLRELIHGIVDRAGGRAGHDGED
jgi:proline iminopeptidase